MYTLGAVAAILGGLLPRASLAQGVVEPDPRYQGVAQALTALIEQQRAEHKIPAVSVALVDGSRVVWARGFGWADSAAGVPATAATVYRVGSVSKLFTDIAVMQLVERGKLALDAPITRYLPDFHPRNPFGGEITLRQLTSHRSGLTREPPVGHYFDDTEPTLAATVASLNRTSLIYPPGKQTKYSNAGIAVLGDVLERTQGESFYPYLQHAVLEPLGMRASAFQPTAEVRGGLAKGYMWTLDGRRFEAPDLSARGGTGRQSLHHRARSQPLHVGPVRRRRAPRRQALLARATLRLDVDSAVRRSRSHHRASASASISTRSTVIEPSDTAARSTASPPRSRRCPTIRSAWSWSRRST